MSQRSTHRNLRPAIWLGLSALGFLAALALGSTALALLASLAVVGRSSRSNASHKTATDGARAPPGAYSPARARPSDRRNATPATPRHDRPTVRWRRVTSFSRLTR